MLRPTTRRLPPRAAAIAPGTPALEMKMSIGAVGRRRLADQRAHALLAARVELDRQGPTLSRRSTARPSRSRSATTTARAPSCAKRAARARCRCRRRAPVTTTWRLATSIGRTLWECDGGGDGRGARRGAVVGGAALQRRAAAAARRRAPAFAAAAPGRPARAAGSGFHGRRLLVADPASLARAPWPPRL